MHLKGNKLLSSENFHLESVNHLFQLTQELKHHYSTKGCFRDIEFPQGKPPLVFLVFFEPSTRTRMSFEAAVHRVGGVCSNFSDLESTSLSKGESLLDTLKVLESMNPDLMVIRYPFSNVLSDFLRTTEMNCINAGSGSLEHPTQALLDAFTIQEKFGFVKGKKVLFVGDVRHSRVANSNLHLLQLLGADVAYCCPEGYAPESNSAWDQANSFVELKSALEWCDVCMALRMQKERHEGHSTEEMTNYTSNFQINKKAMGWLKPDAVIMHPGPFVPNEEITYDVVESDKSLILKQTENGMFVRAALIMQLLKGQFI